MVLKDATACESRARGNVLTHRANKQESLSPRRRGDARVRPSLLLAAETGRGALARFVKLVKQPGALL